MKWIFYPFIVIMLSIVSLAAGYGSSGDVSDSFKIEAGGEWMYGYTLYEIGGLVKDANGNTWNQPFPTSELNYPVNLFLLTVKTDWRFLDNFDLVLNAKQSITPNSGKVDDSDWWVLSGNPNTLDIFSTSDATLELFSIDTVFFYKLYSSHGFSLSLGPGFLYRYFYYNISNLDQYSPSGYQGYNAVVPGQVSTYQLNEYMPYGAMKLKYTSDFISIEALFGLSPSFCSDADNHILRSLMLTASSSGIGIILRLDISKNITQNIFIDLDGEYINVSTTGNQSQTYYASNSGNNYSPVGYAGTINYTQESSLFTVGLDIGIIF